MYKHQTKGPFDSKFAAMHVSFMWLFVPKIVFKYSGPRKALVQKRFAFDNVFRFQFKVSAIKLRNTVKVHYTKDVLEKFGCLTVILGIKVRYINAHSCKTWLLVKRDLHLRFSKKRKLTLSKFF